jgi:hypothetical protein
VSNCSDFLSSPAREVSVISISSELSDVDRAKVSPHLSNRATKTVGSAKKKSRLISYLDEENSDDRELIDDSVVVDQVDSDE